MSHIFFHPDCTVGIGLAPIRPPRWFADFTAGREFHPAPKTMYTVVTFIIADFTQYAREIML